MLTPPQLAITCTSVFRDVKPSELRLEIALRLFIPAPDVSTQIRIRYSPAFRLRAFEQLIERQAAETDSNPVRVSSRGFSMPLSP